MPFLILTAYIVRPDVPADGEENAVIILGLVLLLLGFLLKISILWTIGIILIVVGAVLYVLGSTGPAVGGRRHYW